MKKSLIFILLLCFLTACSLEQTSEVTADQKQEQKEKEEAKAKEKEEKEKEKELKQLEKEQKAQEKELEKEQKAEEKAKEKAEEKAKKEQQKQEKEIAKKAEEEEKLKEKAKKKQEKLGYTAEDVKILKEHWIWQIEESNGLINNITTMDPDDYDYILIYVNDSVKKLTDSEKEKFANEWGNKIKNGVTANLYGGDKEKNKSSYEFRYSDDKLFAKKKILGEGFTVK
ncbi:hypothetical protein NST77_23020 [Niallia sp. FSL W8-0177]|nr:hypothetical protein [Niallia circulans]